MRLQDRATPWDAVLALLLMTLPAHCHPIENGIVQIDGSAIRIMGVIDKTVADLFTQLVAAHPALDTGAWTALAAMSSPPWTWRGASTPRD